MLTPALPDGPHRPALFTFPNRILFGEVKKEANRSLPDLSRRELAILVPLAVMIILLGLLSPLLTERTQNSVRTILLQSESPYYELAGSPGKTEAQR